ncbi:Cyclic pyranopterin monophosphate synthase [Marinomonas spartinae]|uniref:GTP 3',8-cyclase MoaA n=1 Tax=Marinomonas spartinae TaxID=1792290 RepID=UPI000808A31E|nr:GTP 3',8-cyclase MoaA [Marinomonas spartinae]SBS32687.1 Cyclic pyranopterin monophosphate synthase [Marinomonas spartinae]
MTTSSLIDPYGRRIDYLRISVTDRCDFRCTYCMDEDVTFIPKRHILSLEEVVQVAKTFIKMGTKRIRITGGEPLVRKNLLWALEQIAKTDGLEELTITTNGSQLEKMSQSLLDAGVSRINVSLDTLNAERFFKLTRRDKFQQVINGIDKATSLTFKRLKLNSVILKNHNDDEIQALAAFALERGMDISYIEEMPLGMIHDHDRAEAYLSSDDIIDRLGQHFVLTESNLTTGGPTRYYNVAGYQNKIGVISPHSHNFCSDCNRVRLTAEGRLLLCLGNEHSKDLKPFLRSPSLAPGTLEEGIISALALKPYQHHFNLEDPPQILRFMSATGG